MIGRKSKPNISRVTGVANSLQYEQPLPAAASPEAEVVGRSIAVSWQAYAPQYHDCAKACCSGELNNLSKCMYCNSARNVQHRNYSQK